MKEELRITLGNFRYWRIKKLFAFAFCMGCAVAVLYGLNISNGTVLLIVGLLAYDAMIHLPWVKNAFCRAVVRDCGDAFCIRYEPRGALQKMFFARAKESVIVKNEIRDVRIKEMWYGGRWFYRIGYRLIVKADKNYEFDSIFLGNEKPLEDCELDTLWRMFLNAKSQ